MARVKSPGIAVRRIALSLIILIFTLTTVVAQDEMCIQVWQIWSDDARHEVNINTGKVVTYSTPPPTFEYADPADSPDGRYAAAIELGDEHALTLTDQQVGVDAILARGVTSRRWASDSTRLAYMQSFTEAGGVSLVLFNIETAESETVTVLDAGQYRDTRVEWSPDGRFLVSGVLVEYVPERWHMAVYALPELSFVTSVNTDLIAPQWSWSPQAQHMIAYGAGDQAYLFDSNTSQVTAITVDGSGVYGLQWSPDENYLLISHAYNDWWDTVDVVDARGTFVVQDVVVDGSYDGAHPQLDWVSDDRLLASAAQRNPESGNLTGFSDLLLIDISNGEQSILQSFLFTYRMSANRHSAAYVGTDRPDQIQFLDLSADPPAVFKTLTLASLANANFIWRGDSEIIVLFEDRALRRYEVATDSWHDIATIPGDEKGMTWVACQH